MPTGANTYGKIFLDDRTKYLTRGAFAVKCAVMVVVELAVAQGHNRRRAANGLQPFTQNPYSRQRKPRAIRPQQRNSGKSCLRSLAQYGDSQASLALCAALGWVWFPLSVSEQEKETSLF